MPTSRLRLRGKIAKGYWSIARLWRPVRARPRTVLESPVEKTRNPRSRARAYLRKRRDESRWRMTAHVSHDVRSLVRSYAMITSHELNRAKRPRLLPILLRIRSRNFLEKQWPDVNRAPISCRHAVDGNATRTRLVSLRNSSFRSLCR